MKKTFVCLILLLVMFGCSKNKEVPNFNSGFEIETYRTDMSGYNGLTSVNHRFLGTTVSQLKKTIDENGYGAFVLSRITCDHCQLCMKYINQAAEELGVYVYYLNGESSIYPIVGTDDYDVLDFYTKSIQEKDETGEIVLQTPHFFTVVNGKFVDSFVGVKFKDDLNPTDSEIKDLVNKYKKALEVFVH